MHRLLLLNPPFALLPILLASQFPNQFQHPHLLLLLNPLASQLSLLLASQSPNQFQHQPLPPLLVENFVVLMTSSTADQKQIGAASQLLTAITVTRTGLSLKDSALKDGMAVEMTLVAVAALGSACSGTMGSTFNVSETETIVSAQRFNQARSNQARVRNSTSVLKCLLIVEGTKYLCKITH